MTWDLGNSCRISPLITKRPRSPLSGCRILIFPMGWKNGLYVGGNPYMLRAHVGDVIVR